MSLNPSVTEIFCQGCGAAWPKQGGVLEYPFLRFETDIPLDEFQENTLGEVVDSGATLISCPKCPIIGVDYPSEKDPRRRTSGDEIEETR